MKTKTLSEVMMMLKTLLVMMYFVNTLSFEYAQYSYLIIISPAKTRRGAMTLKQLVIQYALERL